MPQQARALQQRHTQHAPPAAPPRTCAQLQCIRTGGVASKHGRILRLRCRQLLPPRLALLTAALRCRRHVSGGQLHNHGRLRPRWVARMPPPLLLGCRLLGVGRRRGLHAALPWRPCAAAQHRRRRLLQRCRQLGEQARCCGLVCSRKAAVCPLLQVRRR